MNITRETIELTKRIAQSIQIPAVSSIHLPEPVEQSEKPDEFGFVFLQDGSVGSFYTSLNDTLHELWQLYPDRKTNETNTVKLIEQLNADSHALRAVALGAFNAVSQHVMSRAGYSPAEAGNMGLIKPEPKQTIGMVGYFKRLIEKLLSQDINVLVLEKNPARVELQKGVTLTTNPADLASCEHILCTASTLINGTLAGLIEASNKPVSFSLIGPSGSGLPDILFKLGVDAVGGVYFDDKPALHDALSKQQSWGHAGRKYQLTPENYPGISSLLQQINNRDS